MDIVNFLENSGFERIPNGGGTHVMRKGMIIVSGADGDLPDANWYCIGVYPDWENPECAAVWTKWDWSAEYPDMNSPRDFRADLELARLVESELRGKGE